MPGEKEDELQSGLAVLTRSINGAGLQIIENQRPWPNRMATYFAVGIAERRANIVMSDKFVKALATNGEHQEALDSYASAVAARIKCGSPDVFYCLSDAAIRVEIGWPIEGGLVDSVLKNWPSVGVTDAVSGAVAQCALEMDTFGHRGNPFDQVKSVVNRVRTAIDEGEVTLRSSNNRAQLYQQIKLNSHHGVLRRPENQIERFLAGKAYFWGFRAVDTPGEVWAADPWDAEYLGVSPKDLMRSAYVLRGRGLVQLDTTRNFASPTDKLLTNWPDALSSIPSADHPQRLSLAGLPIKDKMIADVGSFLERKTGFAVVVVDLDHFKSVNDTAGHNEGDACLERVVKAIGSALGRKGILYRWGGDEFTICLPDFSTEEAHATGERIRRAVEQAGPCGDIAVTASIGVCGTDRMDASSAVEMLAAADKSMYESKRQGKNRVTSWPIGEELSEKTAKLNEGPARNDPTTTVHGFTDALPVGTRVQVLTPLAGKPRTEWPYSPECWVIREVDEVRNTATATPVLPPVSGPIPTVSGPMNGPLSPFVKV